MYKSYMKNASLYLGKPVVGQTLILTNYLFALYKYKNVNKNNITSSVIYIIVCLSETG